MLPDQKLDALVARHAALESDLTAAVPAETYVKLTRELAELAPVVEAVKSYWAARNELDGVTSLIEDPATDAEMRSIAEAERPQLEARRAALEQQLRLALIPKDAMDERNVILEIRAGTGGDEASLFAGDLPKSAAVALSPSSNSNPACIACSACPTPRRPAAFTPRRRPSPCCPRRRMSMFPSLKPIFALTRFAPAAPAASTSTRPNRRYA